MGGTYQENLILDTHSGTAEDPITFKPYNQDEVVIDGGGSTVSEGTAIMELRNVSHIVIEGFSFRNIQKRYAKGLVIYEGCANITVSGNIFSEIHFSSNPNATVTYSENASPFLVYGTNASQAVTDIVFRNNEVFNCRTGYSEGVSFSGNVDGFLVEGNYVHDITNIGIHAEGHFGTCPDPTKDQARNGIIRGNTVHDCASNVAIAGGIYVDGARDIIIENNKSYNGQLGISVGCENIGKTASNITVRNNVVYGNSETGIEIGGYDYPSNSGAVVGASITGNTTFKNDTGNNWTGELWVTYCEDLVVENNIFAADNANKVIFYYETNNGLGNSFNHNLYHAPSGAINSVFTYDGVGYNGFSQYVQATNLDTQSLFQDPMFVHAQEGDFHLEASSPAIDAGNPNFVPASGEVDIDGENRTFMAVDCGADEFQEILDIPSVTSAQTVTAYPNPTIGQVFLEGNFTTISYRIYNVLGVEVLQGDTNTATLHLESLPSGLYFLYLTLPETGHQQMIKLIRQ
jgi:hypothetical protein